MSLTFFRSRHLGWTAALTLALGGLSACGELDLTLSQIERELEQNQNNNQNNETELSADEEACIHLAEGPPVPVSAVSSVTDATIEAIWSDHVRYDIALADVSAPTGVTDALGGWVEFLSDEEAEFVFFLNADVAFEIYAADGTTPVEIADSADHSDACELVKGRHVVDLEIGTYNLWFGPTTTVTELGLVVEELHDEDHDEDDHDDDDDDDDDDDNGDGDGDNGTGS